MGTTTKLLVRTFLLDQLNLYLETENLTTLVHHLSLHNTTRHTQTARTFLDKKRKRLEGA